MGKSGLRYRVMMLGKQSVAFGTLSLCTRIPTAMNAPCMPQGNARQKGN